MKKITIIYGTDTGNTQSIADKIAEKLADKSPEVLDVAQADADTLSQADVLFLGTSTTGYGDLQDDWDSFLSTLESTDLSGKAIALFGLGDAVSYPETFVDGMGTIYETAKKTGAEIVGAVSTKGYTFDESTAVVDGNFVGLALDEDNEYNQTDERIADWLKSLESYL